MHAKRYMRVNGFGEDTQPLCVLKSSLQHWKQNTYRCLRFSIPWSWSKHMHGWPVAACFRDAPRWWKRRWLGTHAWQRWWKRRWLGAQQSRRWWITWWCRSHRRNFGALRWFRWKDDLWRRTDKKNNLLRRNDHGHMHVQRSTRNHELCWHYFGRRFADAHALQFCKSINNFGLGRRHEILWHQMTRWWMRRLFGPCFLAFRFDLQFALVESDHFHQSFCCFQLCSDPTCLRFCFLSCARRVSLGNLCVYRNLGTIWPYQIQDRQFMIMSMLERHKTLMFHRTVELTWSATWMHINQALSLDAISMKTRSTHLVWLGSTPPLDSTASIGSTPISFGSTKPCSPSLSSPSCSGVAGAGTTSWSRMPQNQTHMDVHALGFFTCAYVHVHM